VITNAMNLADTSGGDLLSTPRQPNPTPLAIGLILSLLAPSCGHSPPTGTGTPTPNYPLRHSSPSWALADSIVFQDRGITCVLPTGEYFVDSSKAGIYVASEDGTVVRRVLPAGTNPVWQPQGGAIAFELDGSIVSTPTGSVSFRKLTTGARDQFPDWSPTGEAIVFESTRQMQGGLRTIWTVNTDGSGLTRVGGNTDESWRMPAWSPDGARILHVRYMTGTSGSEVFEMDRDGSNPVRLTTNSVNDDQPRYSPDGSMITFVRTDAQGVPQVWIMHADGTAQTQVSTAGGHRPAWSRDGSRLVYSRFNPLKGDASNGTLWVHNLGSGANGQLISGWPSSCP
jgi:Tol biopolymer transport system component